MTKTTTTQPTSTPVRQSKGFIILNPAAGEGNPEKVEEILNSVIGEDQFDLYRTTGEESIAEVVKTAVQENDFAWVAAVGGDGTVSQVADGLAETDTPLAIIPAGTGNALAQELGIPQDIEAACQLLVDAAEHRQLDAIRVGKQYFFLQMGIGLESVTMQETSSAQKNKLGPVAYLWTAVKEAFGWQPYHFNLRIDGQDHAVQASELVIANARKIGVFDLEWRDSIAPDDGRIDIAVVRARSLADYARLLITLGQGQQDESEHIRFFTAEEEICLEAEKQLPIHGDGEMLEVDMPVTAVVVSKALTVFTPSESA